MLNTANDLSSFVLKAGEPFFLEVQLQDSTGAVLDLSERAFVLSFYRDDRSTEASIDGEQLIDATGRFMRFARDGRFSESLYGQNLTVELAERYINGREVIAFGRLDVVRSAAGVLSYESIVTKFVTRITIKDSQILGNPPVFTQQKLLYRPDITAPKVTLGALSTSGTLRVGTASNGTIIGATAGSTIVENVGGFTLDSAARTYTYDGSGPAATIPNALIETHPNATNSGRQSALTLAAAPIVLAELSLSAASVTENTGPGATIGGVLGKTSGSTLSLVDNAGSRFVLSDGTIVTGATSTDYETARSHGIVIRETLAGATNSPRDTPLTIAVVNTFEQPSLRALMLSTTALTIGTASNGAINDAATGSTIAAAGLPAGLTINGGARTWAWSGNGSAGTYPIELTEELGDSPNSPRKSAIDVTIAAGIVAGDMTALRVRDATPLDPDGGSPMIGIDGNGWIAEVTLKGLVAPASDSSSDGLFNCQKLELLVRDPGFDSNLNATSIYRRIKGRALLRKQYKTAASDPRQRFISQAGSDMVVLVALSDHIYAGSTIVSARVLSGFYANGAAVSNASTAGSLTNASTYAYRKPTAAWLNHQHLKAGADMPVELIAFHRHAMGGRQVAGVRFQARDTTGNLSAEQVSTSVALSSLVTAAGALKPECHKATIPLANLAQGELCYVNAKVYPWIGDASAVYDLSTDGTFTGLTPIASTNPHTRLRFVCDKAGTYSAIACLTAAAGNYQPIAVAAGAGQTVDPSQAFDGNYSTGLGFLANEAASNQWVGMSFPIPIYIAEVRIWANGYKAENTFNNFDLEWSDDGSAWTKQGATQVAAAWITAYTQTQTFVPGGSSSLHRYWRIRQNGNTSAAGGTHTGLQELELAATPGGANVAYGVIATSLVEARKAPFVDINRAVLRLQAYNSTKATPTHADYGGGTIYLLDDGQSTVEHGSPTNVPGSAVPGATWLELRPDPANTGQAIWTGKAVGVQTPPMLRAVGLALKNSAVTNAPMFNSRTGGTTNADMLSLESCHLVDANGVFGGPQGVYGFGIQYRSNLTGGLATLNTVPSSALRDQLALALGCISPLDTAFAPVYVGNKSQLPTEPTASTSEAVDGYFLVNNELRFATGVGLSLRSTTRPTVIAQNLAEFNGENGGVVGLNMSADGISAPVFELLDMHNTMVGDRGSRMYADNAASRGVVKQGVSIGTIVDNWNYKTDTFETGHPGNTGNWRYGYQVGTRSNVSLKGSRGGGAPDPSNPLPGVYLGNAWEPDFSIPNGVGSHAAVAALFANWKARDSLSGTDGPGGGDYHLVGSSSALYGKVPAAVAAFDAAFTNPLSGAVFGFDLDGRARLANGNGAVGCYERA